MVHNEQCQNRVFQFAIENAHELAIIFDESGRICYANKAAEEKLEYGDAFYRSYIWEIFPGVFTEKENSFESQFEIDGEKQEIDAYRKNRTCFPLMTRIAKISCERTFFCCMGFDVSERNFLIKQSAQVDQKVEEVLNMKSEFTANVTHELRTPVNGILGNAKELMELEDEPKKRKLLSLIERGCADMNAIINNILDFSKLEAGKFTLETRRFHFRNMIDYVVANHKNKIMEKGVDFKITVSPEIPEYIIGDELRIVQILNNLLSNASKFTSVGQIILEVVKTAQLNNRIELFFLVIDTGIGIDKEQQDKLFKSYSQVDASISRRYGGTGLGLNICKQLVELMDGNIHVESEIGKGSMFSFHIWVEIPQEELGTQTPVTETETVVPQVPAFFASDINPNIWVYGTEENAEELRKKLSKLILSVEMDNWEKAEMFAETLKQLTEQAPKEIKSAALRLKMAVQKGDYEKTAVAHEKLQNLMGE